jgi:hypothetical protein
MQLPSPLLPWCPHPAWDDSSGDVGELFVDYGCGVVPSQKICSAQQSIGSELGCTIPGNLDGSTLEPR